MEIYGINLLGLVTTNQRKKELTIYDQNYSCFLWCFDQGMADVYGSLRNTIIFICPNGQERSNL